MSDFYVGEFLNGIERGVMRFGFLGACGSSPGIQLYAPSPTDFAGFSGGEVQGGGRIKILGTYDSDWVGQIPGEVRFFKGK